MTNKSQILNLKKLLLLSVIVLVSAGCANQPAAPAAVPVQQAEASIQITQKVEGDLGDNLFNIYPSENKTALDLLKMGHKVKTKTFSGLGEFVESINDKKAESNKNFWSFYVNGKQAQVGASTYKPKNKDAIEWKLESLKN